MNFDPKKIALPAWLVGTLVGVFGSLLVFRNLIFAAPGSYLWANDYDTRLLYWIASWGYHSLFELGQPLRFWNANSFFPETNTLAYSDSLLSFQLFFAPLKALHLPALAALYLALALTCVAGSTLTALALRRLRVFSSLEIALIVFVAHFGLSFTSFLYHYQLFGFQFGPAFFLYLYLYLRDFRKTDLAILSGLFCLATAFATYFGPMALILALVLAVPLLVLRLWQCGFPGLLKKIGWGSLLVPLPFILLLYFVQLQPYQAKMSSLPAVKPEVYQEYSASPASIYKCASHYSLWYRPDGCPLDGSAEYGYFPGYLLLGAALLFFLVYFVSLLPRLRQTTLYRRLFQPDDGLDRVLPWFFIVFFFALWFLSLGPHLYILNIPSYPYQLLLKLLPGMANIRTPGRFGILLGLPLAVFLVLLLRRLRWGAGARRAAFIALFLAVGVETLPNFPLYPIALDPGGLYSRTAQYLPADAPLVQLPVWNKKHSALITNIQDQLAGSTYHWGRLLVGYGAASTPGFWKLATLDLQLQQGADLGDLTAYAGQVGAAHYLVHLPDYPAGVQAQWRALAAAPASCLFFEQDGYLLFAVNAQSCAK